MLLSFGQRRLQEPMREAQYLSSSLPGFVNDPWRGFIYNSYNEHKEIVVGVAWLPDSNYVASGSYDKKVKVWQAR